MSGFGEDDNRDQADKIGDRPGWYFADQQTRNVSILNNRASNLDLPGVLEPGF